MQTKNSRGLKGDPTDDRTDAPTITGPHFTRDAIGDGYEYHRCTGCGRESAHGPTGIVHRDGCKHE